MKRGQLAGLLIGLALIGAGCGSGSAGKLTLTANDKQQLFSQSFNQAYISSSRDGEFDIILLQDNTDHSKLSKSTGKPLQPLGSGDLRQVVHIHLFWQASGGSVAKDGVVTNAAINWYVMAPPSGGEAQWLRYVGAGYVLLDEGRKSTGVEIRDGLIKSGEVHGQMRDPLGPSRLVGKFDATRNGLVVGNLLADLRSQGMREVRAVSTADR